MEKRFYQLEVVHEAVQPARPVSGYPNEENRGVEFDFFSCISGDHPATIDARKMLEGAFSAAKAGLRRGNREPADITPGDGKE